MFKLPSAPSAVADIHELADFIEFHSWNEGSISEQRIADALGREDDNETQEGAESSDDETATTLDQVMTEIERRILACEGAYPFYLDREGTVLRHEADDNSPGKEVYRYLLLATRLNMTADNVHADIDGTLLLEEVSARALRHYLGGGRAQSLVFGTSVVGPFREKVNQLCRRVGEGGGFKDQFAQDLRPGDARLDVVAWTPFADSLPSKLVMFGQCKTGTNWMDETTQLRPDTFIDLWMTGHFCHLPIRTFCIAEAADQTRWHHDATYAGLFFDRCRLASFSKDLEGNLLRQVRRWFKAAKDSILLPPRITRRRSSRR